MTCVYPSEAVKQHFWPSQDTEVEHTLIMEYCGKTGYPNNFSASVGTLLCGLQDFRDVP
jgi:hypothetical protein